MWLGPRNWLQNSGRDHGESEIDLDGSADENMRRPTPINFPEGGTPAERLDCAFRQVLTVSKADLLKAEAKEKRQREKKRAEKKAH
jgi:hypothetical protein